MHNVNHDWTNPRTKLVAFADGNRLSARSHLQHTLSVECKRDKISSTCEERKDDKRTVKRPQSAMGAGGGVRWISSAIDAEKHKVSLAWTVRKQGFRTALRLAKVEIPPKSYHEA